MSNVVIKVIANSNISYDNTYQTYIPVEEWVTMDQKERQEVIMEAIWDDIDASPVDEETGEYLD